MRCTRANIYHKNLINNFKIIKKKSNNVAICIAIKANAYGHGALEVAKNLEKFECDFLGISTLFEAEELKKGGIKLPIILFSLTTSRDIEDLVRLEIEPLVTSINYIKLLDIEAKKQNRTVRIHLKIDTGMGRIGCKPEETLHIIEEMRSLKNVSLNGICTHLSTSERLDQNYTNDQLQIFNTVLRDIKKRGLTPPYVHAANSGAIINNKESLFNMVRVGISFYGYPPVRDNKIGLSPALELKSNIVEIKEVQPNTSISYGRTYITDKKEIIATIPVGYADGYSRALSNKGFVIINNKNYPIVGSICMDQLMIKVDSTVALYDEVTLISCKKEGPNAEVLASLIGTISYEILTNIHRVKRYHCN